ncbi:MAG TPA: two-component regulator propeller domain-containing protein [Verrucomicrobiae bacterium]|nr:two-component regulator propeller domain-containing protein [Verrucomicrobiae bacterium]
MNAFLSSALACAAAGGLAWPAAARAGTVEDLQSEYVVDSWQTEHGLPDDFVNSIAQTPEGYIWIATFNGLTRFNGSAFVSFDAGNTPELKSSRLTNLRVDHAGRLWISAESGALTIWHDGHFELPLFADGKPASALAVREDRGDSWLSQSWNATNFWRLAGGRFEPVSSAKTFRERFGNFSDSQGRPWCEFSNCLCCLDPTHPLTVPIPNFAPHGWRLAAARDGGLWMVAHRIGEYHDGAWSADAPLPLETDRFNGVVEDANGFFWVGTDDGELWRVATNGAVRRFKIRGAASSQVGRGLMLDAEGNIWFGTGGSGLFRLKPRVVRSLGAGDGLASDLMRSVSADGAGNVWFAAVNRIDWMKSTEAGVIQRRPEHIVLPWEMLGGRDGSMWAATFSEGLFQLWADERKMKQYLFDSRPTPPINVLFEEANGALDIGTPRGLAHITNDSLAWDEWPPGLARMDVRAMAEDARGRLYVGLDDNGLLIRTDGSWSHCTSHDGLGSDQVRSLCVASNGAIWIGTLDGLSRWQDGKIFNFAVENAESGAGYDLPRIVTAMIEDGAGYLWLASNRGLFRAREEELNAVAEGRARAAAVFHYDRSDGMGSSQCTGDHQPSVWKTKDGRLWFATMNGVSIVDPAAMPLNTRPPPVVIEAVLADEAPQPLPSANRHEVEAPAGSTRLEIRYAALSYTDSQGARFRYRLEGFDNDWVLAGHRRTANYTKVPPGRYRFRLIAANNDNVWNETGASLDIRVLPLFWQTGWFRAAAALAVVGLMVWFYTLRVRHLHDQQALQESFSRRLLESQEQERKRMAAELHDSLGQNLLVVNNYAAMALKEAPEAAQGRLRKISDSAAACIEEVRAIARSLRPYQLDRFGLSKTLEDIGDLLSHAGGLEVATEIENIDGLLSPAAEISVYRIAQEWLTNVVKHAQATRARLVVRREAGRVRLVLEDNGAGFDYTAVMARGGTQRSFGLVNMHERARLLGGALGCVTAAGQGTRWTLEIPYEDADRGSHRG